MELLKFLSEQDTRLQRREFSFAAFVAKFPVAAAGVFSDRMNLRTRIEHDDQEVYDPRVDTDRMQLVVSQAMPVSGRSRDAVITAAYQLLLLRDRPQRPPAAGTSSAAAAAAADSDEKAGSDGDGDGDWLTAVEAVERAVTVNAQQALRLVPTDAAAAAYGLPSTVVSAVDAADFLGMWHKEDAALVNDVRMRAARAMPFVQHPAGLLTLLVPTLCPSKYSGIAHDADTSELEPAQVHEVRRCRRFESVLGALEALRWRFLRAAVDSEDDLRDAVHGTVTSLARRISRRQLTAMDTPGGDDESPADGGADAVPGMLRMASRDGKPTPAYGATAKKALADLQHAELAGSAGVTEKLCALWGGAAPVATGGEDPSDAPPPPPRWWGVLLAWEAAVTETELAAMGTW